MEVEFNTHTSVASIACNSSNMDRSHVPASVPVRVISRSGCRLTGRASFDAFRHDLACLIEPRLIREEDDFLWRRPSSDNDFIRDGPLEFTLPQFGGNQC
jgi:hypothetical protein